MKYKLKASLGFLWNFHGWIVATFSTQWNKICKGWLCVSADALTKGLERPKVMPVYWKGHSVSPALVSWLFTSVKKIVACSLPLLVPLCWSILEKNSAQFHWYHSSVPCASTRSIKWSVGWGTLLGTLWFSFEMWRFPFSCYVLRRSLSSPLSFFYDCSYSLFCT